MGRTKKLKGKELGDWDIKEVGNQLETIATIYWFTNLSPDITKTQKQSHNFTVGINSVAHITE